MSDSWRIPMALGAYLLPSLIVFQKIFTTSELVVDEEFHLPQGMAYCEGNWSHWEPKLTTPPGIYLISAILSPALGCSPYAMRLSSLLASCLTVAILRRRGALHLSLLPPLYFFSHLYYTDAAALASLLLALELARRARPARALLACAAAVLVRQTNVVWVAFCFGRVLANSLVNIRRRSNKARHSDRFGFSELFSSLVFVAKSPRSLLGIKSDDFKIMLSLFTIMAGFVAFVFKNGSIVLGDKSAHEASIHVPQLFYFCLFYSVFSMPLMARSIREDFRSLVKSYKVVLLQIVICALIVHLNTSVHPYLLADNRHYTFYIWNRFFGRFWWAKYACVPAYVYIMRSVWNALQIRSDAGFYVPYTICLIASLVPQRLLEPRYFLVPFIILRLEMLPNSRSSKILETLFYLAVNCLTFYVFFTKEIQWSNYDKPQRMIW